MGTDKRTIQQSEVLRLMVMESYAIRRSEGEWTVEPDVHFLPNRNPRPTQELVIENDTLLELIDQGWVSNPTSVQPEDEEVLSTGVKFVVTRIGKETYRSQFSPETFP